jgi:hypothetical protein
LVAWTRVSHNLSSSVTITAIPASILAIIASHQDAIDKAQKEIDALELSSDDDEMPDTGVGVTAPLSRASSPASLTDASLSAPSQTETTGTPAAATTRQQMQK